MAPVPFERLLLVTTLLVMLVSCDARPDPPVFTSYFTSPTNLRVEWNPGEDMDGGTVSGFRLHYKLGSRGKLTKLKIPASPFTYDIEGLAEACGIYQVRMATLASSGLSRYTSFESIERTVSAPKNLNVVAQSGSSARINWTPPVKSACIGGYQLQYGPSENNLKTIRLPADLEQYILTDLESGTSYLLTLAATADGSVGEETFSQWYQAPDNAVVPPIPREIRTSQSDTEIVVTWQPPEDTSIPIQGYILGYGAGSPDQYIERFARSQTEFTITDLTPDTVYVLKLRAFNQAGEGVALYLDAPTVPRTPERVVPPIPREIRTSQSDTEIVVTWQPPEDTSIPIQGYILGYGAGSPDQYIKRFASSQTEFTITDLTPDTMYVLKLRAFNQAGEGEALYLDAPTVPRTGPPTAPTNLQATPTSSETVIISWSPTASGLSQYTYLYGPVGTPDSKLSQGNVGPSFMIVELEGLTPGEEYLFKVSSVNSVGQSGAASLVWAQPSPPTKKPPKIPLPSAPRQVSVRSTSPQTAIVSWTQPEGDINIEGYIVGFGLSGTSAQDLLLTSIASDEFAYEMEGLKVGTQYMVMVQAYNNDGDGAPQMAQWLQENVPVQLSLPTQPRGVLAYSSSPTSIDISWMLSEVTGPTDGFRVTYGSTPSADEFRAEVGAESDSIEILDLMANSFYYLRLYAFNSAGQSDAVTRSIQTLDLPPEERCILQQEQCIQQFASVPLGAGAVCSRIRQYLNCLQLQRDSCMHDAGYRARVASVRGLFLNESCNRNPQTLGPRQVVPGLDAAKPEVIPAPSNLEAEILSPSSARFTWTDDTLGETQVIKDNRFYNIRYRSTLDDRYIEERTRETQHVIDSLLPGVPYEITVQLILDPQRRSPISEGRTVVTRDPVQGRIPERFTVLQVTVASATTAKAVLNWLPPPERGAPMNYIIEYTDSEEFRDPATVWERITLPGTQHTAVIDDLTSDLEYHARIQAVFSQSEMGPMMPSPTTFTTPVIPPSHNVGKQCEETEEEGVRRRVGFLWDGVVDGVQRPPLYGVPIPYCDDDFSVEECHGIFCFCIPGKKPPALREPECAVNLPPCSREYEMARKSLDEARQKGIAAISAMLPHCRDDGFYHPKQCSGTMCYCVTENGAHTGQERPVWEAARMRCQ